jgi:4-diphosphocytidyl-2-C-methyl-D-erythritol kinase
MQYLSPAKLNLFFRVLHRRPDGYHEIASLYQAIDRFDLLSFNKSTSDQFTCSDAFLKCDDSNLVSKARHLFRSYFECPALHIHLEKKIPMQSGLGGGSSNAATTLWAMNEIAGRPASLEELLSIGALIGSDVPFFFSSGRAFCTGRGEMFKSMSFQPFKGYLAKPSFGLSTPIVYRETRVEELEKTDPLVALQNDLYFNDLEEAAMRIEPMLFLYKKSLLECGFDQVTMTGSGTAFFCLGEPKKMIEGIIPFQAISRESSSWY